jgi:hypothetical protein
LESVRLFPILTRRRDVIAETPTCLILGTGWDGAMEASRRLGFGDEVEAEWVGNGEWGMEKRREA